MTAPAPLALRVTRVAHLAGHLARGLAIAAFRYGQMSEAAQRSAIRRWSRDILSALGVTVRIHGLAAKPAEALPPRCLMVSNHVSWMDILVLLSVCPATFVAKSEIRGWPLVGWLCARVGTLFIERGRRASARRTSKIMSDAMQRGTLVCIFPEGTTTDGLGLARFHAALFQPAVDAAAMVQPVVLRYLHHNGQHCAAPNYVGETSFLTSMWSTTSAPRMVAELSFLMPFAAAGCDRRVLARTAESAVAAALGAAAAATAAMPGVPPARGHRSPPGTSGDHPGGSP